ncbi:hypothetical protein Ais01nite_75850 [Asanoa ishikariensis]|uniref:Uncharacterized protein n=1 Tax=Asanoa ishikariensis TaxID=137265 RepID=A0A1H3L243_9ACTN|nr:hypothetical protein [Asanoa ishikariensis]GIF69550.1 hypothetical protein Ais01nite_75850 [Asanoa ishikariensis]SDY58420.1 hypothetical protein SAMN05421684_0484 [Asanoa ishikariensis]
MTTRLEEELAEGMRSWSHGLRPTDGLVAHAARQHRRRRRRSLTTVGAVAAVAIAVTATLGQTSRQPEMLSVAAITKQASAALAGDDIEHSVWTATYADGVPMSQECWRDPVTTDRHCRTLTPQPGARNSETWRDVEKEPSGAITWLHTNVDHTDRTWTTRLMRFPEGDSLPETQDPRSLLESGLFHLVGAEVIDGNDTLHIRRESPGATDDIWVDAETFHLVRTVRESDGREQLDYDWLPRDAASLRLLEPVVPEGYVRR